MVAELDDREVRVLGCLVEKAMTTPEYYPLSLNALKNACNQKSSRDPVADYDESAVLGALESLRDKHLVWFVSGPESRVVKYKQRLPEALDLAPPEAAALCLLMLRGPQTAGEIKGRSERLYAFRDLPEVEAVLLGLAGRAEQPLALRLPRQPGRKEPRFAHLLSGGVVEAAEVALPAGPGPTKPTGLEARVESLEAEVLGLKEGLTALKEKLESIPKQPD